MTLGWQADTTVFKKSSSLHDAGCICKWRYPVAENKTRCDYQASDLIVKNFKTEADNVQKMNQNLSRNLQTLEGGAWVGKAATAFFGEMNGIVMPSLKRLQVALSSAAKSMSEVSKEVKQTEEATKNILNGNKLF